MTIQRLGPHPVRIAHVVNALLGCAALLIAGATMATPVLPDFQSATFDPAQPIDNPYFPLTDGSTLTYTGSENGHPVDAYFEHTNQGAGPVIAGVQSFVQHDREFEDGLLIEDTFDYFAQDTSGNVWYLGEDTTAYTYDDQGNLVDTDTGGSWRAGVNGAEPGFIMPVDRDVGFNYYQEFAQQDEAVDQATTQALLDSLTVAGVTYEDVLQVLESTDLEPGEFEFKYYAPGVGLILVEEDLDENLGNPGSVFSLQPGTVPAAEPATLGVMALGLLALGAMRRCR